MIIRFVKMTFQHDKVDHFLILFDQNKGLIRNFPGCNHLELLRDIAKPTVFFTYSKWDSEDTLNQYRNSLLFANVWSQTKLLFADKPEAWSVELTAEVNPKGAD